MPLYSVLSLVDMYPNLIKAKKFLTNAQSNPSLPVKSSGVRVQSMKFQLWSERAYEEIHSPFVLTELDPVPLILSLLKRDTSMFVELFYGCKNILLE